MSEASEAADRNPFLDHAELAFAQAFERAKARDEFEYACSLMRIRGIQPMSWDPLLESRQLIDDMLALIQAPHATNTRARLALLLYAHITEMDAPYEVLGNMLRVARGERCRSFVLFSAFKRKKRLYPIEKIELLKSWAEEDGDEDIGKMYDAFFSNTLRNAVAHSDYSLSDGTVVLGHGETMWVDGVLQRAVPFKTTIEPRLNAAIAYAVAFQSVMERSLMAYDSPKIVMGRLNGEDKLPVEIQLKGAPETGLTGFISPPPADEEKQSDTKGDP